MRLEGPGERADLVDRLALHRGRHHRRRRLADRAALAADADVGDDAVVVDVEVDDDLVAAQRVEALDPVGRRRVELAPVPRVAVVVEDDLAVEVFEAGHRSVDPDGDQKEEVGGGVERVGQRVDVGLVVVDVERGPGGGADAEHPHERLGAVVAGAHAHAVLVEHLGDVVRVDVVEGEREHAAALGRARTGRGS